MQIRKLGRTGLKVSTLCLGGNVFGWTIDEATSFAVLDAFVAGGGNFIDTADTYFRWAPGNKGGESETILGHWMRARKNRDHIIIATKVGQRMGDMGDDPNAQGLSRQYIMHEVEASLRRLQTDYIDLYQAHIDDQETPLDETLRAFDDLIRQGKVRYTGASNYSAWRLTRALWESDKHGCARYESIQPPYNLLNRETYERELEMLCLEQQIGVITYTSLAAGFLSGKYRPTQEMPSSPRARGIQKLYMNERGYSILKEIDNIAASCNATPAQIALAWIIARPGITAPIVSATSVEQIRELLGVVKLKLDDEARAMLDKASSWRKEP